MSAGLDRTIYHQESGDIPIYHISYCTNYWMNASVMRISELYGQKDSPFSFEDLMDKFAGTFGTFTYFEDYHGHTLDEECLRAFYRKFKRSLTKKELFLKGIITNEFDKNLHFNCKDKFQIIFTHQDDPEFESTLNHELCHAIYALDPLYVKEVDKLIKTIPVPTRRKLRKIILDWEYPRSEFKNELNAYLSTSQMFWFRENMQFDDSKRVIKEFRAALKHAAKRNRVKLRKLPPESIVKKRTNFYNGY